MTRSGWMMSVGTLVAAALAGCSGGARQGIQAQGTATLDGQPLSRCLVILSDESGDVVRQGKVDDGRFTVVDIPPGKYRVAVRPVGYSDDSFDVGPMGRRTPKRGAAPPAVPVRYQDAATSTLTVEVRRGNELKVALTSP